MLSRNTLFWIALAASVLYAATGVIELAHDQPTVFASPLDYWLEAIFVAALAASAAVLATLAGRGSTGAGATTGWALAACGHLVLLVAALATAIEGREALDPIFPLGFLAIVAGYIVLAVLDARKRLVPKRAGLVLLAGFVGAVVVSSVVGVAVGSDGDGGVGGGLVLAAAWAALARLISESMTSTSLDRHRATAAKATQ
jgi:hypothetical protein